MDLTTPRTPAYLSINPRGLVPSLSYDGNIVTESAVVAQFLADAHPSTLLPASNTPGGALARARIAFFADAYTSKVLPIFFKSGTADASEIDALATHFAGTIVKELEPLLQDAAPFFGGSSSLTQAEVLTGSFVIRLLALTRRGVYPEALVTSLPERAPKFWKWAEAVAAHPSVTKVFNEEAIVAATKNRLALAKAEKGKAKH